MKFIRLLLARRRIRHLAERQLAYLVGRFDEWHSTHCPRLTVKEALSQYQGIGVSELFEKVK